MVKSTRAANSPIVEFHPNAAVVTESTAPLPTSRAAWPRSTFVIACVIAVSAGLVMLHAPATNAHRGGIITGSLAVTSLLATLSDLAIMAVLHTLPTGYSPVRHAVSDYGVGRYSPVFNVALYVSSVGVLTLASSLLNAVGTPPSTTRDLTYLLLLPLARIGMTLFPTSLKDTGYLGRASFTMRAPSLHSP